MKILLAQSAVYVPTHGGENKANRLLLEALARRGHECRVLAPAAGVQAARSEDLFLEELARREIPLSATSPRSFSFEAQGVAVSAVRDSSTLPAAFAEEIRSFAPDRILVSSEDPGHGLLQAAAEADPSRTVYLAHTMLFFPFGPNSFARSHAMTEAFRRLGGVITVSAYLQRYIREWSGREAAVIPFPAFGAGPFPRLGRFDSGAVTFINPCAYKGITIFLELARTMPDVAFAAVPSWGTTAADRSALERQRNVRILPARDDLDALLADTRALLVPSLWGEGFPLVPVEAMLRGIPVLASDSGGLPEAKLGVPFVLPVRPIEKYTDRFDEKSLPIAEVPEQDVDPWRGALRSLLSDRAVYEQIASQSRSAAEAYAGRLSAGPFETYLEGLPSAPSKRKGGRPEADKDEIRRRLEHLTPEKRALLLARLRKTPAAGAGRVPRRGAGEEPVVSFAQERLWVLDRMDPGNAAYNNFDAFRVSGPLDVAALDRAFSQIVRRHETLRMTFGEVDGRPVPVVARPSDVATPVTDLTGLPPGDRETEAVRLAIAEARQPFDLSRGPLLRPALFRLGPSDHLLLLVMHHIVSDGWSFGVFLRELSVLYESFAAGATPSLSEPPVQYGDFARWQRLSLSGEALDRQLAYWKDRLSSAPPVLELASDRPRPRVRSNRGGRVEAAWNRSLTDRVAAFSLAEGVTPFMTLLAAFQAVLLRWTGQEDIVVGTPAANRSRSELEAVIGFFVNTLVVRVDASSDPTFRELLRRVRESAVGAFAHQEFPFEKLVEVLRPERDPSHTPIFQVMMALQNAPRDAARLGSLLLRPVRLDPGFSKFDLTLDVTPIGEGMRAELEYSGDLFERETAERLLGHVGTLLESALARPAERLSRLPLLTGPERERLLFGWNPPADSPAVPNVHERFESQVAQRPGAVAAVFEEEQLTYAELNRRANRLAHHLRALGVGPEVVVGLYLERSLDLVVAILGVLKAGGAYVPLDLAFPPERLAFMLADTRAALLVTKAALTPRFSAATVRMLCMDADAAAIAENPEENPPHTARGENAAYVIYTSGSTGKPKGVVIRHENVARLFSATEPWFGFGADDVWTMFHSCAFDFSVWEMWGALLYGGRLVVVPYWVSRTPEKFLELLHAEKVTVLNQTPSAFRQLMVAEESVPARPLALREVVFGGEALELESLRPWLSRPGDGHPRLTNMYGITETTVHVTGRPLSLADLDPGRGSVIGRPIPDLQVYVLDRQLQPVPVHVAGEMYVGGRGVARGYLGRPELTAERFVPDPFTGKSGGVLYRTGDLARYRPDGDLEYIGRADQQVKIRGFRIELGEIESRLLEHPNVREAVLLSSGEGTEKRLVAYLAGDRTVEDEVRSFLKEVLPEYMVPSAFVWLDRFPLTANGKVDRAALPAPDAARTPGRKPAVGPRTPAEAALAEVWTGVLGRRDLGVHDNFFELGGDSILAIQVVARAHRAGLRLSPRQLFERQTIAELAAVAQAVAGGIGVAQGPVTGPVPLTPVQRWFFEQELPERHHFNQAVMLEVPAGVGPHLLERAGQALIDHHDALRLQFSQGENGWSQMSASKAALRFSTVDVSGLGAAARSRAIAEEAGRLQQSLELTEGGGLVRMAHFNRGEDGPGRLLWIIHHLAVDGVSWRVLLEDLQVAVEQLRADRRIELPPKTQSFQDWAGFLARHARSEEIEREAPYWTSGRRRNTGRLPRDFSLGPNTYESERRVRMELGEEETRALLQDVPRAYGSQINEALLAPLAQVLGQWVDAPILVDLEGHGREEIESDGDFSRTVGWFTAIAPILLDLEGISQTGEVLKSVKEQLRSVPRKGIGHGLLRYMPGNERWAKKLQALPQAEISFNYLGRFDNVLGAGSSVRLVTENSGDLHSPRGIRSHLVGIDGIVTGNRLRMDWTYSSNLHRAETIERLADEYGQSLRAMIRHCQSPEAGGYTPSDFPEAGVSQAELDSLARGLAGSWGERPR